MDMQVNQQHLKKIAVILRSMADDLEACGADEWDSLEDCINGTANNVFHDLGEYKKEAERLTHKRKVSYD